MDKKDLRIVYMGTPEFAVESLKRLVEGGYNIVGVITMPDKPMGRHGSVLQPSPVKQYAVSQGLRLWSLFVCCLKSYGVCRVWVRLIFMLHCFLNTVGQLR